MKKLLIPILLSFTILIHAQNTTEQEVDDLFKEWTGPEFPGGSIGVIKEGELIYTKGYGLADLEHQIPNAPNTVFYIGSVSKQFVTFCILLLEEEGKLNLDDEIQVHLPDFPKYKSPLTIRHFIHHTSGVRDYLTLMALKGRSYLDHIDENEVYELIKRQKELNFAPGERYLYSNSCYFMLAMIIEKASGKSIKEYAEEHIFDPLGMDNSKFHDDNTELILNRAFSYEQTGEDFDNLISRFDLVGSGGVYSTVEDLYLWDQNFYNNKLGKGGQDIINKMHEDGLLNDGTSAGYAYAVVNGSFKNLKTVRHGGSLAGYRSEFLRFPDEKFSVIILANRSDANTAEKAENISIVYLREKMMEETITKPVDGVAYIELTKEELETFTGTYSVQTGIEMELTITNDTLWLLQKWDDRSYPIYPTNNTRFIAPDDNGTIFQFDQIQETKSHQINIDLQGELFTARRKTQLPDGLIPLCVGKYYSRELDVHYTISAPENDKLSLQIANKQPQSLEYVQGAQFNTNGLNITFLKTDNGVSGLILDAGRVQGLKFQKIETE